MFTGDASRLESGDDWQSKTKFQFDCIYGNFRDKAPTFFISRRNLIVQKGLLTLEVLVMVIKKSFPMISINVYQQF